MRPAFGLFLCVLVVSAQPSPAKGTIERITVHGKALEGNLAGDSADRSAVVYLPPGYADSKSSRYPVIYFLHGFTDSDEIWMGLVRDWIELPSIINRTLAQGGARETIVVVPNAYNRFLGSMYSASATTGDWESFIARDLVAFTDSHYRTIPQARSRGLAGHSMGGYGALRIGMKHPEIFSAIYLLNPCCLAPLDPETEKPRAGTEAVKDFESLARADSRSQLILARCAAWAPDPDRPPLFLDPLSENGEYQPGVVARWAANTLPELANPYLDNLRRLHAIAFDTGAQDGWARDARVLDEYLTAHRIQHGFEVYEGDHINRVEQRIQTKMLAFFTANLEFR
jgi:S-formylglutathione hydrolase